MTFCRHDTVDLGRTTQPIATVSLLGSVVEEVRRQLIELIRSGRSVILDHGLRAAPASATRDYKQLVNRSVLSWRLLHFRVGQAELRRRLAIRNEDAASCVHHA